MDPTTLDFIKTVAAGQLRHLLTGTAGALIAKGVLQSDQQGAFVQIGMGLAAYGLGAALSWWQKDGRDLAVAQLARLRKHVATIPAAPPATVDAVMLNKAVAIAKTL